MKTDARFISLILVMIGLLLLTGCVRPLADRRHTDDSAAQLQDAVKVIQTATAQAALTLTRAAAPTRTPSPAPRATTPAPTPVSHVDGVTPTAGRGVTVTPAPRAAEGVRLYLREKLLSTEPPAGNASARFECYGACAFTWPMTLTVPLNARSYGYRLDITGRFNLKLTLAHAGSASVLVDARRLTAGSPSQGVLGGAPLTGVPGDVLTLELNLPDGGQILGHQGGSGGLADELFGSGGSGSASFITLSQAEPPPTPPPTAPVAARLAADRGASSGPAIAAGPDDTLHIAWAATSEGSPAIVYARSSDGGVTFSTPVTVTRGPEATARGAPAIAGGANGAVAIAWEEKRDGAWGIAYSRSTDGKSFSPAILMGGPTVEGDRSDPTLASAPDGTLYLAWRDLRVGENGGIYFARAAAGGDFGPEMAVSPSPEFQGDPVLAVDQRGRVHLAWTDRRDGPVAVCYARADDGATFGAARRISGDDNHTPSLALDKDGGLHLAWASKLFYVYHTQYAVSQDGGDSFSREGNLISGGGTSVSVSAPLTAIAAGTDGTVYVAFRTNSPRDGTVLHYDRGKNGAFGEDVTIAGDKGSPAPGQPAMTSDSRGRVFLAWGEYGGEAFPVYLARAEAGGEFSAKGKVIGGETGIVPTGEGAKATPGPAALPPGVRLLGTWQYSPLASGKITVDKTGNLWMNLAGEPEIQHLAADGKTLLKFGSFRPMGPFDIAVDGRNDIYVLLQQGQGLQKFSADGQFLLAWDDARLGWGYAIAIDAADNVYVADSEKTCIQKFTADGHFLLKWGTKGSGDGEFLDPISDMAIDAAGNVYVVDGFESRIQKFTPDGRFLLRWRPQGNGGEQFNMNNFGGMAVDASGNVFVTDKKIGRVQKFDPNGRLLLQWGAPDDGLFPNPSGIAVDGTGKVYVMSGGGQIRVFAVQ